MEPLACISENRRFLMGFAILWVLPVHLAFVIPTTYAWLPLNFAKTIGYGGVDIFLFLSGFGLFCSLHQNSAVLPFYGRRLKRLLPSYLPAVVIWVCMHLLFNSITFGESLGNLLAFGWWIGMAKQLNWYTQAIFLFYLLAPLLFRAINGKKWRGWIGGLLMLGTFSAGCLLFADQKILSILPDRTAWQAIGNVLFDREHLIALSRLPVFLLGMYAGQAYLKKTPFPRWLEPLSYGVMIVTLGMLAVLWRRLPEAVMWDWGIWWYPFVLITPGLCLLLSRIADWVRARFLRPVVSAFERMGAASYEIYLSHFILLQLMDWFWPVNNWTRLLLIALSILAGLAYERLITAGVRKLGSKRV